MGKRLLTLRWLLICVLSALVLGVAACTVTVEGFTAVTWWRETHSGFVWKSAATEKKLVALTFDDGPDPLYTPRILDVLRQHHIKATFFLVGRQVEKYPELARRIVAEGHIVGSHTYTHPVLPTLDGRAVGEELDRTAAVFSEVLHLKTPLFRPPYGEWNPTVFDEVRRRGGQFILWTVAFEHREVPAPAQMIKRALRLLYPGGVLLMHDGDTISREPTVQALPLLLEGLEQRGYRCVTIPELFSLPEPARL